MNTQPIYTTLTDVTQGKRYGRRGPDNRIIEAYGFDLSPLAQRCEEFIRVAAAAKAKRRRIKLLRSRITIARRGIAQAGETLAGLDGPLPPGWQTLAQETAELVAGARRVSRPEDLADFARALEFRRAEAERWAIEVAPVVENPARAGSETVKTDPTGLADKPHNTNTNLKANLSDTVIAAERSKRLGTGIVQPSPASHPPQGDPSQG